MDCINNQKPTNKYQFQDDPAGLKKEKYRSQLRCSMSSEMRQHCPIISRISGQLNLNCYSTVLICAYLITPYSTSSYLSYSNRLIFLDITTFFIFYSIAISYSYSNPAVSGMNSLRWLQKTSTSTVGHSSHYYYSLQSSRKMYLITSYMSSMLRKKGQTYRYSVISFWLIFALFLYRSCNCMSANEHLNTLHLPPIVFLTISKSASLSAFRFRNYFLSLFPDFFYYKIVFFALIFRIDLAKFIFLLSIYAFNFSWLTLYLDSEVEDFLRVGAWQRLSALKMFQLSIFSSMEHLLLADEQISLLLGFKLSFSLMLFGSMIKLFVLLFLLLLNSTFSGSSLSIPFMDSTCLGWFCISLIDLSIREMCSQADDFLEEVRSLMIDFFLLSFSISRSLSFREQFNSLTYSLSISFCNFKFSISFLRFQMITIWFLISFSVYISLNYFSSSSLVTLSLDIFMNSFDILIDDLDSISLRKSLLAYFSSSFSFSTIFKLFSRLDIFQRRAADSVCQFSISALQNCASRSYLRIIYLKCIFSLVMSFSCFNSSSIRF